MTQGILLGEGKRGIDGKKGFGGRRGKKAHGKMAAASTRRGLVSILVMAHCTQSQIEFSEEMEDEEGSSGCELKRVSERGQSDMMSAPFQKLS